MARPQGDGRGEAPSDLSSPPCIVLFPAAPLKALHKGAWPASILKAVLTPLPSWAEAGQKDRTPRAEVFPAPVTSLPGAKGRNAPEHKSPNQLG